jgi:hypothetical protein
MELVTVYRTFSSADAHLIRSLLEAADIPATVTGEFSSLTTEGYSMTTGGIRVQVSDTDVESARELIENKADEPEG